MRKVYIAGPMRGLPKCNFPAFTEAKHRWQDVGWHVFSPHSFDLAHGYTPDLAERAQLNHVAQTDMACLYAADAIALLPGWEHSVGATMELAMAQFLQLEVYCAKSMFRIEPASKPWRKWQTISKE